MEDQKEIYLNMILDKYQYLKDSILFTNEDYKKTLKIYSLCSNLNPNHEDVINFLSKTKDQDLHNCIQYINNLLNNSNEITEDMITTFAILKYIFSENDASICVGANAANMGPSK